MKRSLLKNCELQTQSDIQFIHYDLYDNGVLVGVGGGGVGRLEIYQAYKFSI